MKISGEIEALFSVLRQSAKPEPVSAIEKLIEDAPDRELCRINALAFAAEHQLDEEDVIAAFLHGARLGIFDVSWNILCPGCGGVLDSGTTDRKSTRLNSSHGYISYAVFCLKKKQMTTSTTSIDIKGLHAAYATLHTDPERDYLMPRYHYVIFSFGGKTSYDADNRPLLVMRSNLWASGYDVDGTDQTSLGQFSGRVQQTYKHSVPFFFVPEHRPMFTLALVRFPPTATKEIQYLNAKGALTYTDIAGDPVLYGNLPPREISMKDVFRSGDSSKKFKIAEGQWYRYAPSYVSPAYHLIEGFPFIQEPPSGDLQERVLIRHHDYDQCFQSVQLLQWNSQVKFNVTVYRNLPTTRDSIMTS